VPAQRVVVELTGVSCPDANDCDVVGWYYNSTGSRGLVLTYSSGTWNAVELPLPSGAGTYSDGETVQDMYTIDCAYAADCIAAGKQYRLYRADVLDFAV
jgi:hypothetical protein